MQSRASLFTSDFLDEHWGRLDDFEGDGYDRVLTQVHLGDGEHAEAFIYVHVRSLSVRGEVPLIGCGGCLR